MRRKPDESDAVQDGHFLPDPTPTGHVEGDAAGELDSKSSVLRLFPLLSGRQLGAVDSFVDGFTHLRWRSQKSAWVSTLKACILAAKVRFQQNTICVSCVDRAVTGIVSCLYVALPPRPHCSHRASCRP